MSGGVVVSARTLHDRLLGTAARPGAIFHDGENWPPCAGAFGSLRGGGRADRAWDRITWLHPSWARELGFTRPCKRCH